MCSVGCAFLLLISNAVQDRYGYRDQSPLFLSARAETLVASDFKWELVDPKGRLIHDGMKQVSLLPASGTTRAEEQMVWVLERPMLGRYVVNVEVRNREADDNAMQALVRFRPSLGSAGETWTWREKYVKLQSQFSALLKSGDLDMTQVYGFLKSVDSVMAEAAISFPPRNVTDPTWPMREFLQGKTLAWKSALHRHLVAVNQPVPAELRTLDQEMAARLATEKSSTSLRSFYRSMMAYALELQCAADGRQSTLSKDESEERNVLSAWISEGFSNTSNGDERREVAEIYRQLARRERGLAATPPSPAVNPAEWANAIAKTLDQLTPGADPFFDFLMLDLTSAFSTEDLVTVEVTGNWGDLPITEDSSSFRASSAGNSRTISTFRLSVVSGQKQTPKLHME